MFRFFDIILAAKNGNNGRKWGNLLFLIVVGVIYALSGLLNKVKQKQFGAQEQEHEPEEPKPAEGPRYKPIEEAEAPKPRPEPELRPARIMPHVETEPLRQPTREPEPIQRLRQPAVRQKLGLAAQAHTRPRVALSRPPEPIKKVYRMPLIDIDLKTQDLGASEVEKEQLPTGAEEHVIDLAEAENLRAAIIYSEIIGKPLSMR